ncbi:hypothetical protein AWRIB429_2014 [Oenococcus oeni AWRIB429]|uniref:HNH nuclease domain-containing protein n=1 Tax=Oenococcus oeni AWRIB429 TaxID=655225 RepID=D3LCD4_OENOE|nr:HNH endonuclease signature motif containing protein [Oenococcus oeni]EFD87487.1 hypothetical protein AWRIB429_2014 [Oenococcus oeni AWRIB429]QGT52591.1 HNH homing endonuclease [Lactococcus phage CHPC1175]QGT52882.1 HNH homing endonuclease [Lactococcus phage CHPC148]
MTINQGGDMEMKSIPDYPNYAVTRDGRVWSYISNKFIKPRVSKDNSVIVNLNFEGIRFRRNVARLVFIVFKGYEPEIVRHIDGNPLNNNIDNLKAMSKNEHLKSLGNPSNFKNYNRNLKMIKVDVESESKQVVAYPYRSTEYDSALLCCNLKRLTYKGALYFWENRKNELIEELKVRIMLNNLRLNSDISEFQLIGMYKRNIKKQQKYLEILEKI